MKTAVITLKEYQGFQRAYDFFNSELFAGSLPQVLVTLQRHANTRGYFAPLRFKGRIDKQSVHELALNPDNFQIPPDFVVKSQSIDIIDFLLEHMSRPYGVHLACRHRTLRGELLAMSEDNWSTT